MYFFKEKKKSLKLLKMKNKKKIEKKIALPFDNLSEAVHLSYFRYFCATVEARRNVPRRHIFAVAHKICAFYHILCINEKLASFYHFFMNDSFLIYLYLSSLDAAY